MLIAHARDCNGSHVFRLSRMEVNPFSSPRDFTALKSERERLESFSRPPGWPIPFIRPEDCARAGFFFLQDGDKVNIYIPFIMLYYICK